MLRAPAQDICAILCGLVIAQDYRRGQRMLTDRNFKDNAQFFQVRPPLELLPAAAVRSTEYHCVQGRERHGMGAACSCCEGY